MSDYGISDKNRTPYRGKDRPGPVGHALCAKCQHEASAPLTSDSKHRGCGGEWKPWTPCSAPQGQAEEPR